jgi:hypothetical protein
MECSKLHFTPTHENDMTTEKMVARRKLSLLQLATELNNVSRVYQVMGDSHWPFYEIRRNFQTYRGRGPLRSVARGEGTPSRPSTRRSSPTVSTILPTGVCGSFRSSP